MLINDNEYLQMHEIERSLWWYKILHEKVLANIKIYFGNKNIKILDAGCGTGGLIQFLSENGYSDITGFDYSKIATRLCENRSLNVFQADILYINEKLNTKFDLIICNDVLYQFTKNEIAKIIPQLIKLLDNEGIIISNNQAFDIFGGIHDIAVGSKQRFEISFFEQLFISINPKYAITEYHYWSLLLAPLILTIRIFQKIKIKLGLVNISNLKSDVKLPPKYLNDLFYKTVKFEESIFKKPKFGSSLFWVFKKPN
jgi:SAM-dependent methyltransferase